MSTEPVSISDLCEWLLVKISDAESALKFREQTAAVFRSGTDESWEAAAKMHPSTAGKPMSRADRIKAADSARYRMLGNAVTTTVAEWLGHQIVRYA